MHRWLLTIAAVLSLVTIGGQCRGSLAQSREMREFERPTTLPPHEKPTAMTGPMTAAEWRDAVIECEDDHEGVAVVRASRVQGRSAGVVCVKQFDGEQ
jgi:hypothetical protein